jgi:hypothetical protein
MKTFWATLIVVGLGIAGFAGYTAGADKGDRKVDNRVFELRIYYAAPGKMKALHARFREHTCKLFEKHGMTVIGFWTPADATESVKLVYRAAKGDSPPREVTESKDLEKLVYILAFPSREAAAKSWKAFRDDSDWKAVKEASEKDGTLVTHVDSIFLSPTDYSLIK